MSDTVQQLKDARALIKAGWVKGEQSYVARFGGRESFCAVGALVRAGCHSHALLVEKHLRNILDAPYYCSLPVLNDRFFTRKRHVLKAFDLAIAEVEAAERKTREQENRSLMVVSIMPKYEMRRTLISV